MLNFCEHQHRDKIFLDHVGQAGWYHLPGGEQAHDGGPAQAVWLLRQAGLQPPAAA